MDMSNLNMQRIVFETKGRIRASIEAYEKGLLSFSTLMKEIEKDLIEMAKEILDLTKSK